MAMTEMEVLDCLVCGENTNPPRAVPKGNPDGETIVCAKCVAAGSTTSIVGGKVVAGKASPFIEWKGKHYLVHFMPGQGDLWVLRGPYASVESDKAGGSDLTSGKAATGDGARLQAKEWLNDNV